MASEHAMYSASVVDTATNCCFLRCSIGSVVMGKGQGGGEEGKAEVASGGPLGR